MYCPVVRAIARWSELRRGWCLCAGVVPVAKSVVSPQALMRPFPASQDLAVVVPSPPAKLRCRVWQRRREQASNPARARHQISGVHLRSDDLDYIKPNSISTI
jgi:hypothetical protein